MENKTPICPCGPYPFTVCLDGPLLVLLTLIIIIVRHSHIILSVLVLALALAQGDISIVVLRVQLIF